MCDDSAMTIDRYAVRALVLSPEREVLLIDFRPEPQRQVWLTPGGGIQPGETSEQALRRELDEELGLTEFTIGPLVARRIRSYFTGSAADGGTRRRAKQHEEFYVIHQPRFAPRMSDPIEILKVAGFRWWSLPELHTTRELVVPRTLADIVGAYLDGPPRTEIGWEIEPEV